MQSGQETWAAVCPRLPQCKRQGHPPPPSSRDRARWPGAGRAGLSRRAAQRWGLQAQVGAQLPGQPVRCSHRLDARSPGSPFAAVPRGPLGPSPSLPDALEAPHPGQSLLLLGAQVPNSAAHGALSPVSRTSLPAPPPGLFLPGASDVGPAPAPWRAPLLPRPVPPALRPGSGTFPTIAKTHPTRGREVTCPRGIPEHRLQAWVGEWAGPPGSSHLLATSSQGLPQGPRDGQGRGGGASKTRGQLSGITPDLLPNKLNKFSSPLQVVPCLSANLPLVLTTDAE